MMMILRVEWGDKLTLSLALSSSHRPSADRCADDVMQRCRDGTPPVLDAALLSITAAAISVAVLAHYGRLSGCISGGRIELLL